jgi:hypothetical protein
VTAMQNRLPQIVDFSYQALIHKIDGGRIVVSNEASFQLHFSRILETVGRLFEFRPNEIFFIELEKNVKLNRPSAKSGSENARIDIHLELKEVSGKVLENCAIELKFYQKKNHREPNNRYDAFKDLSNLERYRSLGISNCYMVIGTDHPHYVHKEEYSSATADFDFRHGAIYKGGTKMIYETSTPHGPPMTLQKDYHFEWDSMTNGNHFLKVKIP